MAAPLSLAVVVAVAVAAPQPPLLSTAAPADAFAHHRNSVWSALFRGGRRPGEASDRRRRTDQLFAPPLPPRTRDGGAATAAAGASSPGGRCPAPQASAESSLGVADGSAEGASERQADAEEDSLEAFGGDVARVVHELRAGDDPTIPPVFLAKELTLSHVWTKEMWDKHISRRRYLKYILNFPFSRLLRRVWPHLLVLAAWSALSARLLRSSEPAVRQIQAIQVPLAPLGLVSTFLAAMITLRTNQGLSRLAEGRVAWGRTILLVRDTAQLLAAHVYPRDRRLGLLAGRHIAMYGWLLKCKLRDENDDDIVDALLPQPSDAAYVKCHKKRATALIARIRQVAANMESRGLLPVPVHRSLESNLLELNHVYGLCERIKGSCIPPMYTAHCSRLLVFYLLFLPLALHGTVSEPVIVLIASVVGYSMLGMDEVSHLLEQPFRLMPMHQQSANAMGDAADAFLCQPPPLPVETGLHGRSDDGAEEFRYPFGAGKNKMPAYW